MTSINNDDEILKLLESEQDLTPEMISMIEEYQQLKSATIAYPVGSKCAISFAFQDDIVLIPSIVLANDQTDISVLVLTPITKETVPCHDYFNKQKTCKDIDNCTFGMSHGYILSAEYVTSFEALGTTDAESLVEQLQYGKRVWCKESNSDIWKLAHIIDQLHGPRWRVRLKDISKKRFNVDIEHIMPYKSLLQSEDDEAEEWSESDSATEDNELLLTDGIIMDKIEDSFGSWQKHTTGFAAKMMEKMGYVEGQGLGAYGEGRLEPIQAVPYITHDSSRPGLGHQKKKKGKSKKKAAETREENVEQEDDMFGLMNSLLGNQKPTVISKPAAQKPINFKSDREANQAIARLQSDINKTQADYMHATEAYRRNKGSAMSSQFSNKLKSVTKKLEQQKKELIELERQVKTNKQRKDMYTF